MSPANILIIFILVIMIFMFIVIIACGKTIDEQCDPKPDDAQHGSNGTSGSGTGSGSGSGSGGSSNSSGKSGSSDTTGGTTDGGSGSASNKTSSETSGTPGTNVEAKTDDTEEIQCRGAGEQECGHNQTSNINDPIKIPQKFLDFFNTVATSYGLRGDLNDTNWEKVSTSKNTRTQSLSNLDIKIAKYYNSIDTTKEDDFMPTTAYENAPWYKDSTGFRNMLTLMQTQLMRAYISKESQYYQSKDLRNILDFATTQIMSHFPKKITATPWGDPYLWRVFAVTVPQTLFIWLICRNCKMNSASDENNIDKPMFTKTLKDVDKIDRLAIDIFNKFYAYPKESDCQDDKEKNNSCWIIGMNVPRPTTETFIIAFPWIMGRIFTTMYTQTLLLDDLLVSFKITAADKANNAVQPDQIIEIVKPLAGLKFGSAIKSSSQYENILYQDGTSVYRFHRFDVEIINSLRLSTEMINNLLFEGTLAAEKEHFYRKCVFSKIETPFLQIHPHQYFPYKKNRVSDNSNQGKYGAFVMNICGLIAMKQKSWSLVYRGQRAAIYSIVHNEDLTWEDSDIQIYSKEIFDKNTSENVEQVAFPFKTGVVRSDATKDQVMAVRNEASERTLFSDYNVLVSVHLNDNVNHSAVGLGNNFQITTDKTYFLPSANPVVDNNPDIKPVKWSYQTTELILVTNSGMHVCLIIDQYRDVQDTWDNPDKHTYWLGLAHTYNTGIKTQTVKTIKANQSYQLGNMYIYLNDGFKTVEVTSFKDGNDITQYGLRGQVQQNKFISYSIVHTKGDEESSTVVPNELLTKPTMTFSATDKKLNGRIETFDWIYTCVDNKLYLYDRLSQTLKIGTQVDEVKQLPTRILVNRGELRQLIGDERLYKYRVRASSDAQAYYNYDEEGDRQNAKTKDVASYDKNNADPEDSTINYQVTLRDKEAFPNKNLDELTCNQQLREYDRFSYEVRIDDVTEFN